jgi:hypothetical protein
VAVAQLFSDVMQTEQQLVSSESFSSEYVSDLLVSSWHFFASFVFGQ